MTNLHSTPESTSATIDQNPKLLTRGLTILSQAATELLTDYAHPTMGQIIIALLSSESQSHREIHSLAQQRTFDLESKIHTAERHPRLKPDSEDAQDILTKLQSEPDPQSAEKLLQQLMIATKAIVDSKEEIKQVQDELNIAAAVADGILRTARMDDDLVRLIKDYCQNHEDPLASPALISVLMHIADISPSQILPETDSDDFFSGLTRRVIGSGSRAVQPKLDSVQIDRPKREPKPDSGQKFEISKKLTSLGRTDISPREASAIERALTPALEKALKRYPSLEEKEAVVEALVSGQDVVIKGTSTKVSDIFEFLGPPGVDRINSLISTHDQRLHPIGPKPISEKPLAGQTSLLTHPLSPEISPKPNVKLNTLVAALQFNDQGSWKAQEPNDLLKNLGEKSVVKIQRGFYSDKQKRDKAVREALHRLRHEIDKLILQGRSARAITLGELEAALKKVKKFLPTTLINVFSLNEMKDLPIDCLTRLPDAINYKQGTSIKPIDRITLAKFLKGHHN